MTLSQKKCCRSTVQNVVSKFSVNAVQQIDSAIMSGLQRMPWIAVFSAGGETPSTSTMFRPTKAMHSRPVQRPLEKHGHQEWLVALTARVVSMSIQTWDGGVIQRQTSDVESTMAHCREGSGGQEHINEIGFSLEPSASKVLGGVALRVLTSLLRTPVEQQHWILIAAIVAVFQTRQLALSNSSPAYWLSVHVSESVKLHVTVNAGRCASVEVLQSMLSPLL